MNSVPAIQNVVNIKIDDMNLLEVKGALADLNEIHFVLPNGKKVPAHFHVTEIGAITRHFIDCGGTERMERKINFQLWEANDYDHRLGAQKLLNIIQLAQRSLGLENDVVEVEYQADTIGKYGLHFDGECFILVSTKTDCLAKDQCGVPQQKIKVNIAELNSCTPGSGCC